MRPCVLVVDDDHPIRSIVADVLTESGCEVHLASNGVEALDRMRVRIPDVLVTDLRMPVLDGWSLVQICRADPTLKHIPIFVVTAEPDGHPEPLKALGPTHVFAKPFDIHLLLTAILSLVTG
jgi:CheY-like chemotaxis protein